ncbi:MAG: bifunctional demethylmenaquinone methyltransferase/2-methoxy-6-polyprenyl-1,4-benzoquinol methylase UbiE [Candidatus Omnitrophica bacterium]|nr:bifunctional demethylmenaquinone methyltransferase/2-methoxy-6-polyprenyl-1,4-benzoquinol methylase UbiE [Candidatus Omnitrophota bacterium]
MNTHIPKSQSWQMFNQISPRYDLLNHFLSFGLDIVWRKRLSRYLVKKKKSHLLDLATGTGDVILTLVQLNPEIESALGIDMAEKMLEIGRKKIEKKGLSRKITLKHADANQIPSSDYSADNITMAFGIRNVEDPVCVLKEMHRVLKNNGRSLILEFSLPQNSLVKWGHLFYLRTIVPALGWLLSGHYLAYKYLNQTIENFPYGKDFCDLMQQAGFKNVKANELLFGVATIYQGEKVS